MPSNFSCIDEVSDIRIPVSSKFLSYSCTITTPCCISWSNFMCHLQQTQHVQHSVPFWLKCDSWLIQMTTTSNGEALVWNMLSLLSIGLTELSLNSQGTHHLLQSLPIPITYLYITVKDWHSQATGEHWTAIHNSFGRTSHSTNASLRPLSGPSHDYSLSRRMAIEGFGSQPLRTCQLIHARHTKTMVLGQNTHHSHWHVCTLIQSAPWHL